MPRAAASATPADTSAARIYAVVRRIPRGSVATYGEVASLAGIASGHRVAARAMRVCPESLPWQRVLGKKDARRGHISIDEPDHAALQRGLLEREGVVFDAHGCVSLARFGWLSQAVVPREARGKKKRRAKAARKRAAKRRP
jgi:methylated-DNA-protein-cysteine methyltransferase related protein